jgi:hypothetical protein
MRIKALFTILLSAILLFTFFGCSRNNTTADVKESPSSDIQGLSIRERAIEYAIQQLAGMKEGSPAFYEPLGFTETEITDSKLGNPFKIYLFDDTGQFFENSTENFVFPLVYQNDIIGIIEVAYLPDSGYESGFSFTFGKSFAEELSNLNDQYRGDDLIIGNLSTRLLLAISGEEVTVFVHNFGADINEEQTNNVLASIYSAIENPDYFRLPE